MKNDFELNLNCQHVMLLLQIVVGPTINFQNVPIDQNCEKQKFTTFTSPEFHYAGQSSCCKLEKKMPESFSMIRYQHLKEVRK